MTRLPWHITRRVRRFYWRHIRRNDVHACADCGVPTNARIGDAYWLTSHFLWGLIVGTEQIVLCPGCFTRRARRCGVPVRWRAINDRKITTKQDIDEIRAARKQRTWDGRSWNGRPLRLPELEETDDVTVIVKDGPFGV